MERPDRLDWLIQPNNGRQKVVINIHKHWLMVYNEESLDTDNFSYHAELKGCVAFNQQPVSNLIPVKIKMIVQVKTISRHINDRISNFGEASLTRSVWLHSSLGYPPHSDWVSFYNAPKYQAPI